MEPKAATDPRTWDLGESGLLAQLFGFVQFEFAGALAVADGRYLSRDGEEDGDQRVLVVRTLGAKPPPPRRWWRARETGAAAELPYLSLTQVTVVRAFEPFASAEEAESWLGGAFASGEAIDALVQETIGLLNRALHAKATASADPYLQELSPERAVRARIGYGAGEDLAGGRFAAAREIDVQAAGVPRRRRREEELRPQERIAAVLAGRDRVDACETLLLRARADLDGGRLREAALQLSIGLDALLVELVGALVDPRHGEDMTALESRRGEAAKSASMALAGDLDAEREQSVRELLAICERVLRRRRVLRG